MLMVSYFTILLRVEVRRELEFAYARVHPSRPPLVPVKNRFTPFQTPSIDYVSKTQVGMEKNVSLLCFTMLQRLQEYLIFKGFTPFGPDVISFCFVGFRTLIREH
jgi:hypothetical protein